MNNGVPRQGETASWSVLERSERELTAEAKSARAASPDIAAMINDANVTVGDKIVDSGNDIKSVRAIGIGVSGSTVTAAGVQRGDGRASLQGGQGGLAEHNPRCNGFCVGVLNSRGG